MRSMNAVIEEIRVEKGITKSHIARAANRTGAWYTNVVRGKKRIPADLIPALAKALGETPTSLYARQDDAPEQEHGTPGPSTG